MGQQFVLSDIEFTDDSLPVLRNDPLLSSGSLLLVDFGHSLGSVVGVPVRSDRLPNIAGDIAATVTGQADNALIMWTNTAPAATEMKMERTPKKGFHVIRSQVTDVAGTTACLRVPPGLLAYLLTNKTHSYYLSIWQEVTRTFTTNGSPNPHITALAGVNIGNDKLFAITASGSVNGSTNLIGQSKNIDPTAAVGDSKIQVAVNGISGTLTSFTYDTLFSFGGSLNAGNTGLHVGGSQILYRVYLEDLSVSGRDYATVKALDDALYAAAFATGGKFFGDTFTDPATLP